MSFALMYKIAILLLFVAIVISLASGMFFLVRDKGQSNRTAISLTIRISLSIALFLMLIIGFITGIIQPHGIHPTQPTQSTLPTK